MSSSKSNEATVSTYYVGLHFVLGHGPFDKITKILVGGELAWEGSSTGGNITIDQRELFGGLNREGGIAGTLNLAMGTPTQTANTYLTNVLGPVPAYRKIVSAIWQQGYVGTNYYLKEWEFEATRIHTLEDGTTQWYDATAELSTQYYLNVINIEYDSEEGIATVNLYKDHGVSATSVITVSGCDQEEFNLSEFNPDTVGATYFTYEIDPPGVLEATGDIAVGVESTGLMNGVHIIHECLTNTTWGYGYTNLDDDNWQAAALECYNEGLGFGFYWSGTESLADFINTVGEHIQATIYLDRFDGLYKIKLIRKLTDTESLLDLTTHYGNITNFARKSLNDLACVYTVHYNDSNSGVKSQMTVQDFTLYIRQEIPIKKTKTYSGIIDPVTAHKIAQRDLLEITTPTYSFTIECDDSAKYLNKGDAFKITPEDYLDSELIMRVVAIDLGTPTKRKITIQCIQDTFTAAELPITNYIQSRWVSSINLPQPIEDQLLIEVPYYIMAVKKGDSFAQSYSTDSSAFLVAAKSVTSDSYSAGLWSTLSSNYVRRSIVNFCYWDALASGITKTSTSLTVTSQNDINLLSEGNFIQIDNELIQVTDISGATLTIVRGVLDTVPETHAADAEIIAWHDYCATDDIEYFTSETVYVKLTTITPAGELDISEATADNITLAGRMHLPYPPANVQLDSSYWPANVAYDNLDLTWATRNRIQQTAGLVGFYTGSVTSESGVTYSGELRRVDTDALLDSFSGESGTSKSFTTTYEGEVYFKLWSVRDSLDSLQTVTHYFTTTAP